MGVLGFSDALASGTTSAVLPETAYVLTRSQQPDGAGGTDVVYAKGDPIPCGVAPLKGGEYTGARALPKTAGDRLDDRTTHVITVPADTEINEKDEIEVEGRGKFEVTALRRRSIEILREVEAREAG